jgi:hypothetical protein
MTFVGIDDLPRAVKSSHVWAREIAELNLRGLVVLVGVNFDGIAVIFLPFSLQVKRTRVRARHH